MERKKKCEAFTLVELMVTMVAFVFLVMVVGSMLIYGWRAWRDYSHSVAMQRDAMVAMRIMEREIRNSSADEISADNDGIYFDPSPEVGRSSTVAFLKGDIPVSEGVVLTSWETPAFNTNRVEGATAVEIRFGLANARGTDQRSYEMTVYPRN